MVHALDLRLWEKIRIEEKNKSLGIPPPDSETHDKFYNNLSIIYLFILSLII